MLRPTTISLIVSTYNRPDALEAVLRACLAQDDDDYEIIVTDDGSADTTRQCIERIAAGTRRRLIHVWQPDDGFRLSRARNQGVLAARGDYVVFLDGDCVPRKDFISSHRRLAQPGCMITGSRVLLCPDFTRATLAERRDLQAVGLDSWWRAWRAGNIQKILQLAIRLPDLGRVRNGFTMRRIKGCNMSAWRSDIERVNGFDESFCGWGHEDADFVVRLFNAGVRRKDGAFATEVFHLWHKERERDQAAHHDRLVHESQVNKVIRAPVGLTR
ncbi:glycosyltransferase family 2 protein [Massilia antarctica]|uniref:Glycosyltransferase family 2 protein n=1 Tax=Massilia antarctica TaxID=2765360 RepID=A0AA48WD62_9BURK|nr:glycosyltransferase family 2 protein [Massilia antarctica]QPI50475.1 glycosyltransferase family 2 protein [Massilia antarctica]